MQEIIVAIVGIAILLIIIRGVYRFFFTEKKKTSGCGCSNCGCSNGYKAKKEALVLSKQRLIFGIEINKRV